jgi:hypothetical protein
MSAKNPKSESVRTIFKKGDGAYAVVPHEGSVTRIYRLRVVKSNPRAHFAEPDRAAAVLEARIADEVAITDATASTRVTAITDAATTTDVAATTGAAITTDAAEDAHDIPDLKSAAAECDWSVRRALRAIEDALER